MRRLYHLAIRSRLVVRERFLAFALGIVVAVILWHISSATVKIEPMFLKFPIGRQFCLPDEWLGFRQSANATGYIQRDWKSGDASIVQHTDDFSRRVTVQTPEDDYQSFAIFAPDSMLFGINVNDDETIPSQFAEIVAGKKMKVYNYAVSGWGPGNMLALMTDPRFPPGVSEKRGFVIYSFNDNHIFRAACWPFLFKPDRSYRLPKYVVDAEGRVERVGIVDSNDKLNPKAYNSSDPPPAEFEFFRDGIQWLLHAGEYRRLTARLIGEANAEFQKRFDSQGFIVVFLPFCKYVDEMKALLEPMGIHCLDYRRLLYPLFGNELRCGNEPCLQKENSHPTVSGNRVVATKLAEDLATFGILP